MFPLSYLYEHVLFALLGTGLLVSLHLASKREDRFDGSHTKVVVRLLAKLLRAEAYKRRNLCAQLLENSSTKDKPAVRDRVVIPLKTDECYVSTAIGVLLLHLTNKYDYERE